jgi:hypothetical protein
MVEMLGSSCLFSCGSLSSISFASDSRLTRIKTEAFSSSLLKSIVIPRSGKILGSSCFVSVQPLSSFAIDSNSRLKRIESRGLQGIAASVRIPSSILFVAPDVHPDFFKLSHCDADSCPLFDRWRRFRIFAITVDFQRILRSDSSFRCSNDCTQL